MGSRRDFLKGCLAARRRQRHVSPHAPGRGARNPAAPARGARPALRRDPLRRLQGLRRRLQEANDNPAEFSTLDQLWDTPLDTQRLHLQPDQDVPQRHDGCTKDSRGERLRLHEDLVHALRRPVLRFGLPGVGDDQGSGNRRRRLQPRRLHRLPLLRRRLPLRHSQVPVRLADREDRQVRTVPASPQGRPLLGLRRGLPDRRHAVRPHRATCWPKPSAAWR
jgi:hypothetical protein